MNLRCPGATALLLALAMSAIAVRVFAQGAEPGLPRQPMPQRAMSPGAHARYSKAPIDLELPQLALTAALVAAGGGTSSFDAHKLVESLTAASPAAETEFAVLAKKFGPANVTSFETTFTFVTNDALAQVAKSGMTLPSTPVPNPTEAKALAAALYAAGVIPGGKYDVEYMLDALVSHVIHVQVMNDIDANPDLGPVADANYHLVLAQVMLDLKKAYDI